jgi:uncharacterized protein HemX
MTKLNERLKNAKGQFSKLGESAKNSAVPQPSSVETPPALEEKTEPKKIEPGALDAFTKKLIDDTAPEPKTAPKPKPETPSSSEQPKPQPAPSKRGPNLGMLALGAALIAGAGVLARRSQ